MSRMKNRKATDRRETSDRNIIPLPFEKAIEGLLSVPSKKKPARKKKRTK